MLHKMGMVLTEMFFYECVVTTKSVVIQLFFAKNALTAGTRPAAVVYHLLAIKMVFGSDLVQ